MIEIDGWYLVRNSCRLRQYKHAEGKGLVTIAGNLGDELSRGALESIFMQAGLKK